MSLSPRDIFLHDLYDNYEVIPTRPHAPEVGHEIGKRTYPQVRGKDEILEPVWVNLCKDLAADVLKDPPDHEESLQDNFDFYKTPKHEQLINRKIGHRRMRSPIDGAMIDLIDPEEASGDELLALADSLEQYGENCIENARYIRELGKLRKHRGL